MELKKYVAAITVSFSASFVLSGQNLSVGGIDALIEANSTYVSDRDAHLTLINSGPAASYSAVRVYSGMSGFVADSNYFCWDNCYGVGVDSSWGAVTLLNGEKNTDFYLHWTIRDDHRTGEDSVIMAFYNTSVPGDSLRVTFKLSVSPTIDMTERELPKVDVYPNPASYRLFLKNPLEKKLNYRLVNLAGITVMQGQLPAQNNLKLDISALPSGLYFVQMTDEGEIIQAERLVIAD